MENRIRALERKYAAAMLRIESIEAQFRELREALKTGKSIDPPGIAEYHMAMRTLVNKGDRKPIDLYFAKGGTVPKRTP